MSKFKVGDRVFYTGPTDGRDWFGTIVSLEYGRCFRVMWDFFPNREQADLMENNILPIEIFNTPLYQVLKEFRSDN